MAQKRPITREGYEAIKEKIRHLMTVERPKIAKEIAEARAHGDLKENAEYHSAKDKQGMIEANLKKLNDALAHAEVIENFPTSSSLVQFGARVTYRNLDTDEVFTWQLVGQDEADFQANRISVESPIGKAIIGKNVGESFTIKIPKGMMEIEILEISF